MSNVFLQPCRAVARRRQQPILVMPGYTASDRSTIPLRADLARRGHPVSGWGLGPNEGPTVAIMTGLVRRFKQLSRRHDQPITLVGWSLGGIYAWFLANEFPDQVRAVITLGSPLQSAGLDAPADSIPTTSIWSRWDRIVAAENSTVDLGPRRENVEVRTTHLLLGIDPLTLAVVANRATEPVDDWQPFRAPWPLAGAYPAAAAA